MHRDLEMHPQFNEFYIRTDLTYSRDQITRVSIIKRIQSKHTS